MKIFGRTEVVGLKYRVGVYLCLQPGGPGSKLRLISPVSARMSNHNGFVILLPSLHFNSEVTLQS
jgi:hypothetical protein